MNFLSHFNIGRRLAIGFSLTLAMAVLIAGVGFSRLDRVATEAAEVLSTPLAKERLIGEWYVQIFAAVRRTAAIVKSSDPSLGAYFKDDAAATGKRSTRRRCGTALRNCARTTRPRAMPRSRPGPKGIANRPPGSSTRSSARPRGPTRKPCSN